jgi:hypothetical protein
MATAFRAKVGLAFLRRASPGPSCGSLSQGINQRRPKKGEKIGLRSSRDNEAQTEKRKAEN